MHSKTKRKINKKYLLFLSFFIDGVWNTFELMNLLSVRILFLRNVLRNESSESGVLDSLDDEWYLLLLGGDSINEELNDESDDEEIDTCDLLFCIFTSAYCWSSSSSSSSNEEREKFFFLLLEFSLETS